MNTEEKISWDNMKRDIAIAKVVFLDGCRHLAAIATAADVQMMQDTTLDFAQQRERLAITFYWVKSLVRKFRDDLYPGNKNWCKYLIFSISKVIPNENVSETKHAHNMLTGAIGQVISYFNDLDTDG